MCGRVCSGFVEVSLCCVWESFVSVWGSEYVLCVVHFWAGLGELVCAVCVRVWCGFWGVSLCCVWESMERVWTSEFLLCVGEFGSGLGE